MSKTLHEHLANARSNIDAEARLARIQAINARKQDNLKSCECHNETETDWRKHRAICPVYRRGKTRSQRETNSKKT